MSQILDKVNQVLAEKQAKIVPSNIKSGVQIFDVVGSFGDNIVTKYSTIEEMNANTDAQEGDLGLVYGERLTPMERSDIQKDAIIYFPTTVVFEEAIIGEYSSEVYTSPMTIQFTLTANSFKVISNYSGLMSTTVKSYSSTDGKTYIASTETESTTSFTISGSRTSWNQTDGWDYISEFVCKLVSHFEGLFEYRKDYDYNYIQFYKNFEVVSVSEYNADIVNLELAPLKQIIDKIFDETNTKKGYTFVKNDTGTYLYQLPNGDLPGIIVSGADYYRISQDYGSTPDASVDRYTINLDDMTYTKTTLSALVDKYEYQTVYDLIPVDSIIGSVDFYSSTRELWYFGENKGTDQLNTNRTALPMQYGSFTRYFPAKTQLSDLTASDMAIGKIAYGSRGVVEGDGTIKDSFDVNTYMQLLYGEKEIVSNTYTMVNNRKNIACLDTRLDSITNKMCIPIKLSEYDANEGNHLALLKQRAESSNDVFTSDYTKMIKQDIENSKIYICDTTTDEVLFAYDVVINELTNPKYIKFVNIYDNIFLGWSYTATTMHIYKLDINVEGIEHLEITPGGERNEYTPFDVIAYNHTNKKAYVAIKLDTTVGSVCKYEFGYVNVDTMTYTSIISKSVPYHSIAYNLQSSITSNQDLYVCWRIYGTPDATTTSRYWSYLIDKDDNIINSIENDTTAALSGTSNTSMYSNVQYFMYDDGTYLRTRYTKVDKTTLHAINEESDVPNAVSYDFSYACHNTKVYTGENYTVLEQELPKPYQATAYFPDGSCGLYPIIVRNDDSFKVRSEKNTAEIEASYNWELGSMQDYDILLWRPSCIRYYASTDSYIEQGQYLYTTKQSYTGGTIAGPLSQEEYDVALDTASEILGEEVE